MSEIQSVHKYLILCWKKILSLKWYRSLFHILPHIHQQLMDVLVEVETTQEKIIFSTSNITYLKKFKFACIKYSWTLFNGDILSVCYFRKSWLEPDFILFIYLFFLDSKVLYAQKRYTQVKSYTGLSGIPFYQKVHFPFPFFFFELFHIISEYCIHIFKSYWPS